MKGFLSSRIVILKVWYEYHLEYSSSLYWYVKESLPKYIQFICILLCGNGLGPFLFPVHEVCLKAWLCCVEYLGLNTSSSISNSIVFFS